VHSASPQHLQTYGLYEAARYNGGQLPHPRLVIDPVEQPVQVAVRVLVRPVQRSARKMLEKEANYQGQRASALMSLTMLLHCYLLSVRFPMPSLWPAQLRILLVAPLQD
jgi:hypothetical protein